MNCECDYSDQRKQSDQQRQKLRRRGNVVGQCRVGVVPLECQLDTDDAEDDPKSVAYDQESEDEFHPVLDG